MDITAKARLLAETMRCEECARRRRRLSRLLAILVAMRDAVIRRF